MSLNHSSFAGNIGRISDLRHTQSGHPVVNISVAVNETWKDKNGNRQQKTTWVPAVIWGRSAETFVRFFSKGDGVIVEGKMEQSEREIDGVKFEGLQLNVKNWHFPPGRKGQGGGDASKSNDYSFDGGSDDNFDDDDIPF